MRRLALTIALLLAALAAAVVQAPAALVALYSGQAYPRLQGTLTSLSNRTSLPLFDLLWMGAVAALLVRLVAVAGRARRRRSLQPVGRFLLTALMVLSLFYLWFVVAWGYNYRRPALESSMPRFDAKRVTPEAVHALAVRAVRLANQLYEPAHAQGFPEANAVPHALLASLHEVERTLGRPVPTTPSVPKRPLTARYMRAVGVSGMLAPLLLETYLNPDLTAPERPYVLAHEWAHLSGFAPEEDASFVGTLSALNADAPARYSAWLFLVSESAVRLPAVERMEVMRLLEDGPRRDLDAIAERLRYRVPWLDRASWVAYDRAIRSQGAEMGVAGYGRVIELLVGSGALPQEEGS